MSLPLADVTAFGHPGGGMDMESLASSLKGNPMLQQAMADNPEMQELLNNCLLYTSPSPRDSR